MLYKSYLLIQLLTIMHASAVLLIIPAEAFLTLGTGNGGMSWVGLKQLMATDHGQHGQTDQRSLSPASLARLSTAPERPMFSLPARSTCTQGTTHLALSNCLRPFFLLFFFFYILCNPRLQALVYILPSTTAIFSYAIGSRKLSATEQFFVGAQCHL